MNKILRNSVLSLVTIFSLASCGAPQVEPEVAKQRAQAIVAEQNKEEFTSPKTFTTTAKTEQSVYFKAGEEEAEEVAKMEQKTVVDLEKGYFYVGNFTDEASEEVWVYLDGDKVIAAIDAADIGKVYSETPSANLETFMSTVSSLVENVYATILGQSWLDLDNLNNMIMSSIGLANPVFDGKTTYTSSEEGNLGVSISGDVTGSLTIADNIPALAATADISTKVNFDNNLMQSYKIKVDVDASLSVPGAGELVAKVSVNESLSVKYGSASMSKPNLSNFTLQAE